MSRETAGASIIVPTYREALNIKQLTERLFAALGPTGRPAELIFVDDNSQDGIEDVVEALSSEYPVRLIVRTGERGLSTAVIAGFGEAKYDRFVVLDADLQHPPETVPAVLECLDRAGADFVIASRFVDGASIAGDWPLFRRLASLVARWLAHPIAPLTDPLSGFFAIHRSTWEQATHVNPIGYKIALELYVKGGCRQPVEVPLHFALREAGQSKFSMAEQVRFLRHLSRLYRAVYPGFFWTAVTVALGAAGLAGVLIGYRIL